jgi:hypothetical protein
VEVFVKLSRIDERKSVQRRLENLERSNRHLQHQVKELEKSTDVQQKMEVIELAFKDRCQTGVKAVNRLLKDGFSIQSRFPNDAGIIVELIKWGGKHGD